MTDAHLATVAVDLTDRRRLVRPVGNQQLLTNRRAEGQQQNARQRRYRLEHVRA